MMRLWQTTRILPALLLLTAAPLAAHAADTGDLVPKVRAELDAWDIESAEAAESRRSDEAESTGDTTSSTTGDTTSSTHARCTGDQWLSSCGEPLPPSRTLVLES